VHDGYHNSVDENFVGLSLELYTANDSQIGHLSNGGQREDMNCTT